MDLHTASHETLEAVSAFHLRRLRDLRNEGVWAILGSVVSLAAGGYAIARGELVSERNAIILLFCFVMPLWLLVNWLQVRWTRDLLRQIVRSLAQRGATINKAGIFGPAFNIIDASQGDASDKAAIHELLR